MPLKHHLNPIKVGPSGALIFIDSMPGPGQDWDQAIVDAARTSYQKGTQTKRNTEGLIHYLMKHSHTSPFEMVELKFIVKAPIFVHRQWHRHRTASINEESARYSEVKDEYFLPTRIRAQDTKNKQGSVEVDIDKYDERNAIEAMEETMVKAYELYKDLLAGYTADLPGMAREQARIILPQAMYSTMVWKANLHNTLNFLRLRMDSHAQEEIRDFAKAMAEVVKEGAPITWEAFQEYRMESATLSRSARLALGAATSDEGDLPFEEKLQRAVLQLEIGRQQRNACEDLRKLGFVLETAEDRIKPQE